ncbi:MAG: NF038122 family metalloprotease [Acidobacteriota bacterium]|nr:NF038122 family metalloprotease [Acidobacteriota bacterium]
MNASRGRSFVYFSIFVVIFGFAFLPARQAATIQSPQSKERFLRSVKSDSELEPDAHSSLSENYLIVRSGDGVVCRAMTAREAEQLQVEKTRTNLQVISDVRTADVQSQQGLKIILRGTQQLESFQTAKQAFLRAAAKWESIIQSPITVVIDVDFGPTLFGMPFPSSNVIGGTDPQFLTGRNLYGSVRTALIGQAANSRQSEIFNALPTVLPTDLGTTSNVSGPSAVLRALGQIAPVANPDTESSTLGPPPSTGFNSNFTFDFDPTDGIDTDKTDFEAVAIHELGHALGFISNVGGRESAPSTAVLAPTVWDLFRFRPGGLSFSAFNSGNRVQLAGGNQTYFVGDAELPLSTATTAGTGGDGQQSSHWKDNGQIGTYTGVMDPTAASGERLTITANDLTALSFMGYKVNPNATVTEVLSVDDGSREEVLTLTNAIVVNRYTPTRYPATLQSVRVQIPPTSDGSSPVGQMIRIVAFVDANRTGQPPANPTLIVDRMVTIPNLPGSRFIEVPLTIPLTNVTESTAQQNPPPITSGDLYVGVQSTNPSVLIAADRTGKQENRSFVSTNNFGSFAPLQVGTNQPVNFISRVVLAESFGATPAPALASTSPSATTPGSSAFTLFVQGSNFQPSSVVRWNNSDRQTTFVSGTLLQAQITASDVASAGTASVKVFTANVGESAAANFKIEANRPVPSIARLSPASHVAGLTAPLELTVFGSDFTAQSEIRYNGNARTTAFVSSTQLTTTLQPTDFASAADNKITVATPGPGGGTSSELSFPVVSCALSLSTTSQLFSSSSTVGPTNPLTGGIVVNANNDACPWALTVGAPWVTLVAPQNGQGKGKFVLSYLIEQNTSATGRLTTLGVSGQTLNIRQLGRIGSVSAARFTTPLAPNSIGASFGVGLARSTQVATTQPLPTTLNGVNVLVIDSRNASRLAPLFFVADSQINLLIPSATATGNAIVRTAIDGSFVADGLVEITSVAPALFTANASGSGLAAAVLLRVKADGAQIFEAISRFDSTTNSVVPVPIDFGAATDRLFLLLFGTGIGGRSSLNAVAVQVGGENAPVSYAGAQGDFVGLDQINAELPRNLIGKGSVTVNVTVDNRTANPVTVTFK